MAGFLVPKRSATVRWRGTLEGLLPEQHPARFIWQVLSSLDLSEFEDRYASVWAGPGRPPYHPRVLIALWIYGISEGIETAAEIAKACRIRDDFRWLAGGLCPCDQTLLNFLTGSQAGLASIWTQILKSMHQAGHIDLSVVAEDGTKLRANASSRSFLTAPDIAAVIERLKLHIAEKLKHIASKSGNGQEGKDQLKLRNMQLRLARAELAARELEQRIKRREERQPKSSNPAKASKFTLKDFRLVHDRNVLICPAQCELHFIGEYPTDNGQSSYRLYGRSDCSECSIKARCTSGRKRRIKILRHMEGDFKPFSPSEATPRPTAMVTENDACDGKDEHPGGPRASITEPEAVMMLATSDKKWEPSYNADLAVTRHGIIVSQFLTKDTTDYHHFEPALRAVISAVGKPESWVGDGHYGTQANILLADHEGVFLYAPPASNPGSQEAKPPNQAVQDSEDGNARHSPPKRFDRDDFRLDLECNVLICPAGQELREIGVYAMDNRLGAYRLYGRSNCLDCSLKNQCTDGRGRRIRMPIIAEEGTTTVKAGTQPHVNEDQDLWYLLQALEDRMKQVGDAVLKFRRQTIEPVNAQLKQHGLGRFHVRGLARCAAILTLACIAHNLSKWKARETSRSIRLVA
jgi:transposase